MPMVSLCESWTPSMGDMEDTSGDIFMPVIPDSKSIQSSLDRLLKDNIQHFRKDESENGQHLYGALLALEDNLEKAIQLVKTFENDISQFDLSEEEQGSGFRSVVNIVHRAVECVFHLCKQISTGRSSFLFSKKNTVKDVKAWGDALASLLTIMKYLTTELLPKSTDGNLLPEIAMTSTELFTILNQISQYPFYGRCLGFHYHDSMQKIFKMLTIGLCTFSEIYYSDGGMVKRTKQSLFTGSKYVYDPDARARRIVDVIQYSSVHFVKAFWALAETDILSQVPALVGPTAMVNQLVIVPYQNLKTENVMGEEVVFHPPSAHTLPNPVKCYLLSSGVREGMQPGEKTTKNTTVMPPSESIIFHCHGGGYVSQSTKAQEVYLRDWANCLGIPIFSVDYSLAPDAKYPRPLEEVVCAYVWMLNNFSVLGTKGTKIIVTGDSAGGNLVTGLTIKCIEKQIRYPDGIFVAYTPFRIKLSPSPSRLLATMDPLLPLGFALRCLKAYAGTSSKPTSPVDSPTSPTNVIGCDVTKNPLDDPEVTSSFVEVTRKEVEEAKLAITENISENGSDSMSTISLSAGSPVAEIKPHNEAHMTLRLEQNQSSIDEKSPTSEKSPEHDVSSPKAQSKKTSVWSGFSSVLSWNKSKDKDISPETPKSPPKSQTRSHSIGRINLGSAKLKRENSLSLIEDFEDIEIPSDYYLSPIIASEETLAKFPPVSVMTSEYDFCLDDCVMMSKKLRNLKVPVTLDVLPKLPHGFMNLNLTSKEAHDGCKVAIKRIKDLLGPDYLPQEKQ